MSIKTELERLHDGHVVDIADGAGFYAGTNPPRKLNIAYAISGGLTTNIAKACDIFYGNEPTSMTISEAIAKGVEAGSPYASIADILKAIQSEPSYTRTLIYDGSTSAIAQENGLYTAQIQAQENDPLANILDSTYIDIEVTDLSGGNNFSAEHVRGETINGEQVYIISESNPLRKLVCWRQAVGPNAYLIIASLYEDAERTIGETLQLKLYI